MRRSMTGDSLFSRRRWLGLWLPALLVVAAMLLGGERAAAKEGQTPGFVWGPAAPSELRAPLGDAEVLNALVLAVDADTISGTLLGGPGLLAYVDDASQPVELWQGWSGFVPEKSRILLEDSGVTSVTLTIAGDTDVPVTAQIAEAVAADLRANIGAQVTVVEGDADFVVRQAVLSDAQLAEPSPLPPLPAGTVSFEVTCTPDTFQPDVWVAVECTSRITNNGPEPLSDMTVNVGGTIGVIPNYYWMWYIRDGQYTPIGISDLSFGEAGALQPGQTTASRLVLLLQMSEGTYETTDTVDVGGREGASAPIKFTASSGAEAPPKDLLVTRTLVGEPALEGTPVAAATYETKVTNRGSSAVTALTITDRSDAIPFVGAEPAPSAAIPASTSPSGTCRPSGRTPWRRASRWSCARRTAPPTIPVAPA